MIVELLLHRPPEVRLQFQALQVFGSVVPKTAQGDHNAGRGAHLTSPPRTPVGVPPLFEGREAAYN